MKHYILNLLLCYSLVGYSQVLDSTGLQARIDSLLDKTRSLIDSHHFDQAIEIVHNAEAEVLTYAGKESVLYATICYYYGAIFELQGNFKMEEKYLEECLLLRRKLLGTQHPDYAKVATKLGIIYIQDNNFRKAETLLIEAERIWEQLADTAFDKYHVLCRIWLANVFSNLANYAQAEAVYLDLLNYHEQNASRESPEYANALHDLGNLYASRCDFQKAESYYLRSIEILEKVLASDHLYKLLTYSNLGQLYTHMGNYRGGEALLLKSLDIGNVILERYDPFYLSSVNLLAKLYAQFGQIKKAEELNLESIRILEETSGGQNPEYAICLTNLAFFYTSIGDFNKSNNLFKKVCSLYKENFGTDSPLYAESLLNLANSMLDLKKYVEARSFYIQALETIEKQLGKFNFLTAQCLTGLALVSIAQSDYGTGELFYQEVISVLSQFLGKEHLFYFNTLSGLIDLYQRLDTYEKALPLLLESEAVSKIYLERAKRFMSSTELSQYVEKLSIDRTHIFSFLYDLIKHERDKDVSEFEKICYDHTLYDKGFLLQASDQIKKLVMADSAAQVKFGKMVSLQRLLSQAYSMPIHERNNVFDLEDEINTIEKDLALSIAGYRESTQQVLWGDIRDALKPNEVAIEFIHFRGDKKIEPDKVHYAALMIRAEWESPKYIYLFHEDQVAALIQKNDLTRFTYRGEINKVAVALSDLIWTPLESFLPSGDRIFFSPTGILNRIPMSALQTQNGQIIGDSYEMHQLNSTRQIIEMHQMESESIDIDWTACVFGGINYEFNDTSLIEANEVFMGNHNKSGRSLLRDTRSLFPGPSSDWQYLPWTEVEAKIVTTILDGHRVPTQLFTQSEATEEIVKHFGHRGNSPSIMHIATHGYFFPDSTEKDHHSASFHETVFKMSEHPLIRSGLILAGANHVWTGGKPHQNLEDGVLTAYEVSQMDLSETELVVLSACETGLGDIRGNEGVYGLQRAFKIAGAKNILMSLWQVPDFATQELMTHFYTNWIKEKMDLPQAFRKAQAAIRAKRPDPFYWAGFVLVE